MNFRIAIIVVSFKVEKDLRACLASLKKLSPGKYKTRIFVIDNNKINLGFAGGNNSGIKQALSWGADFVLILNPDTLVDKNLIKELLREIKDKPEVGIAGSKIYFAPSYEFYKNRYDKKDHGKVFWWAGGKVDWKNVMTKHIGVDEIDNGQFDVSGETETIPGTAMFIRREVFVKVGFFDEKYFLYFEESDFCQRAKQSGFKLWYVPKAVVWHKNAQSSGVGSGLQDYYITRNRLLFGFKYAPLRSKFNLLEEAIKLLFIGRPWQRRGVLDFLLNKFGKGSFPV